MPPEQQPVSQQLVGIVDRQFGDLPLRTKWWIPLSIVVCLGFLSHSLLSALMDMTGITIDAEIRRHFQPDSDWEFQLGIFKNSMIIPTCLILNVVLIFVYARLELKSSLIKFILPTPLHKPGPPMPPMEPLDVQHYTEADIPDLKSKFLILLDVVNFIMLLFVASCFHMSWVLCLRFFAESIYNITDLQDFNNSWKVFKSIYLALVALICFMWMYGQLFMFTVVRCRYIYRLHVKLCSIFRSDEEIEDDV